MELADGRHDGDSIEYAEGMTLPMEGTMGNKSFLPIESAQEDKDLQMEGAMRNKGVYKWKAR